MAQVNDKNRHLSDAGITLPAWTHPEVTHWMPEWEKIRDSELGERQIKEKTTCYLPKMSTMDDDEYAAYLARGVFFNMTSRTITGLVGTLFRRAPVIQNRPNNLDFKKISKDGESPFAFTKSVAREIVTVGRHGVLVDMAKEAGPNKQPMPFLTGYIAENILDWDYTAIDGFNVLSRVVLREINIVRSSSLPSNLPVNATDNRERQNANGNKKNKEKFVTSSIAGTSGGRSGGGSRQYFSSYRILQLDREANGDLVYRQYVFKNDDRHANVDFDEPEVITPLRLGRPLDFIPFTFFGPYSNTPGIEKPPILDIVTLNLSHYKSYAHLEHGRFFTGLPIYYVPVSNPDEVENEYNLGPGTVWQTAPGDTPGILEFFGTGLSSMERSLDQKEQQAATLGGRMLGIRSVATAESDNQVALNEKNEQALLLNIANTLDDGMSHLMAIWAWWQGTSREVAEKITVELNKDFLLNISARELRAVHAMYKDGLLTIEVLYDYLRKAEVIPDYMQMDEFKTLLMKTESFPAQPDAEARMEGFPDANAKLKKEQDEATAKREEVIALRQLRATQQPGQPPEGRPAAQAGQPPVRPANAPPRGRQG